MVAYPPHELHTEKTDKRLEFLTEGRLIAMAGRHKDSAVLTGNVQVKSLIDAKLQCEKYSLRINEYIPKSQKVIKVINISRYSYV
ncbi:hypothetical protein POVCU1_076070 [Plasmodium ovale curtisi]|nr:hypothetical protein POVCU1_076070 [Plasmodium ovale curtisi]